PGCPAPRAGARRGKGRDRSPWGGASAGARGSHRFWPWRRYRVARRVRSLLGGGGRGGVLAVRVAAVGSGRLRLRLGVGGGAVGVRGAAEGGSMRQEADKPGEGFPQLVAVDHHVHHPVFEEIFGALEPLRQLLADRLLYDAGAGEADEG